MITLSLAEIAEVVGGRMHDIPDASAAVTGPVVRDSREAGPGSLFVAFVGERVDGHDFAAQVVEAGAVAVLGSRPVGVPAIVVDDVQGALGALARHVVRRLGTTLVALTGSAGKTSTKDLIAQVLRRKAPTVFTPGSMNNEVGLPLTALTATDETKFLVLEMGARGIGHIRYLCELTPPRIGLVLNVGSAHIGEFGGREQIAQAKGELVEALPAAEEGGTAVLNADDPLVRAMASRTKAKVILFRRVRRSGRVRRERATHGHRTAFLQPSHTLRCKRCDHAPVR
ncbi:UDP-N-acetylmuramoyl-tripeptide--D-alanyl-D-alanine ligase [Streptomyces sp. SAI-129]